MASAELKLLSGIRVLSFTHFMLGPAGVQYLADMGADVIKVEPPRRGAWERSWAGGDTFPGGESAFFMLANRNCRSITLDLKTEAGQEVARRLMSEADVIVENFRPGILARFGLGYEEAKRIKPDIIYASGTGYGAEGPYRDLPAQDLLIQAMSGLASVTGREGQAPVPSGVAVVDQHSAVLLAMAVLAALVHRERTGEGQRLEVIMLLAALDLGVEPIVYSLNGGEVKVPKERLGSAYHAAPYGIYETLDGHVAVSVSPVKLVRAAFDGAEELAQFEDPAIAFERREDIRAALDPHFRSRKTGDVVKLLREHGVWCTPVQDYDEVFDDPAVVSLDPLMEIDHPRAGKVKLLKHPVRYSSGEPAVRYLPPTLGEHTASVLAEAGYTEAEIASLEDSGVV
ncbi:MULTISPECIES: CaiB/BaiF CoA transferase family protein [unclassified Nocardioides]|uniref:CaiB/BaiF CoA transferase family protein n=1 Tax=unclassified Nocardioides TaxID=2615069 RepID=UPI0009F04719|nr:MULTISPECIES: CaiB/BaiF CoA-transferase family protein [unclassified Nocardioides]GAW47868.1 L-carnitine dehydratase/bile acid-inducible protein F [Nocardioides sp. PD653-B2]GAW53830.1 L-carnitine dehydratase/bile acid-inducible protein F [Nocardioides sp. PD653]